MHSLLCLCSLLPCDQLQISCALHAREGQKDQKAAQICFSLSSLLSLSSRVGKGATQKVIQSTVKVSFHSRSPQHTVQRSCSVNTLKLKIFVLNRDHDLAEAEAGEKETV